MANNNELIIHVMHGYDSLEAPTGEHCFGCYIKGKHEIYVADDIPKEQLFYTMAHEYMHYLQDIEGKEFNEKEADDFAQYIVGGNKPKERKCRNCKYLRHLEKYGYICTNGDSEHIADYMDAEDWCENFTSKEET